MGVWPDSRFWEAQGYDEAVDAVMQGTPLQRVAQEFLGIWVAHGRGLVDLRKQLGLDADRRSFGPEGPEVWVLWGPSGTGKSRFVAKRWPKAFWKSPEAKWWDGYAGQEVVVLDDFKDYAMPLVDLQRLLDWYPLWVEVKGDLYHAGQGLRHHRQYRSRGLV